MFLRSSTSEASREDGGASNIKSDKPWGMPVFTNKFDILKCWNYKAFNKTLGVT